MSNRNIKKNCRARPDAWVHPSWDETRSHVCRPLRGTWCPESSCRLPQSSRCCPQPSLPGRSSTSPWSRPSLSYSSPSSAGFQALFVQRISGEEVWQKTTSISSLILQQFFVQFLRLLGIRSMPFFGDFLLC